MPRRNVLIVGLDARSYERLAPVLGRKEIEVDRFPGAEGALELLQQVPFGGVMLGFPLPGADLPRFLADVRSANCPSRDATVGLVPTRDRLEEAQSYLIAGVDVVVPAEADEKELEPLIVRVLDVQPRRSLRVLVRLETMLGAENDMSLCMSEDISATGMLLVTSQRPPVGTEMRFELTLPDENFPLRGQAVVTRWVERGVEGTDGVGLRFRQIGGAGQAALNRFLGRLARRLRI